MSASSFLTKVFILYSIIPLNKWYMTTLWGVGGGLFQAAADTKRSADAAAQKAQRTAKGAVNTAVGGAMAASAYKNAYQNAALNDNVTGMGGAGGQAAAITTGVGTKGGAGGDSAGGIDALKGNLTPKKSAVAWAGIKGAAMSAVGVNPRMASVLAGNKGAADYDKKVGTTSFDRAVMEKQMAIDRQNEQNYGSKGYNPDPQNVWYKKNADGSIDRSSFTTQDMSGDEDYSVGTYVPIDNNAAIASDENQELLKERLDSGIETGNHFVGAGEIKDANGNVINEGSSGVLVERGSRLADANRIVDSERQKAAQQEERRADFERGRGLMPETAVPGYAKMDKKGNPIPDSFTTNDMSNDSNFKPVTRTTISPMVATAANQPALQAMGNTNVGNSSDGDFVYTAEGATKASAVDAVDSYNKKAEKDDHYYSSMGWGGAPEQNDDGSQRMYIPDNWDDKEQLDVAARGMGKEIETDDDGRNYVTFNANEPVANLNSDFKRQESFEREQTSLGVNYSSGRTMYVKRDENTDHFDLSTLSSQKKEGYEEVRVYNTTDDFAGRFDKAKKTLESKNSYPDLKLHQIEGKNVVVAGKAALGKNGGLRTNLYNVASNNQNDNKKRGKR